MSNVRHAALNVSHWHPLVVAHRNYNNQASSKECKGNKNKPTPSALVCIKMYGEAVGLHIWCSVSCPHLAGGSQQGAVLFPAQTLQLITVLLQNCRHLERREEERTRDTMLMLGRHFFF